MSDQILNVFGRRRVAVAYSEDVENGCPKMDVPTFPNNDLTFEYLKKRLKIIQVKIMSLFIATVSQ